MTAQVAAAGAFTFPGTDLMVHRMGYGAMRLSGPQIFGPPRDPDEAVRVLRRAVEAGVNHIDTSDYYGPHITNQIIKQALHPYPDNLVLVSKVGARRGADASWIEARTREEIISAVHDNLKNLGIESLAIVNLRMGDMHNARQGSIAEPLSALIDLKKQGLVRHIGLSTVNAGQIAEAQASTDIVCVQNLYNIAHREDDALLDNLAKQGIAYVPYFPLGGFSPLQSSALNEVAAALKATPMQVALAWLLQRAPNLLLIPGTSSLVHCEENLAAATLSLPADVLSVLDGIAKK